MGEKVFTKSQYGVESAKGSAVAATKIWPGTVQVPNDRKVQFLRPVTGRRGGAVISSVGQVIVDPLTLAMDPVYIEGLPLMLAMLLDGSVANGSGLGKWVHTPSLTAAATSKTITLEYGDDTQAYEIEAVEARSLKISGRTGEDGFVKAELNCWGKQITKTTFTNSLTTGTLTPLISNLASLWIDPAWATLGTTAKTGLLREWDIELTTGKHPKFLANGALTFGSIGNGDLGVTASLTFEGGSSAVTEYDAYMAQTARAIRLLIGDATNGLQIDMYGKYETVLPLGSESDGNNLHVAVFQGMDDNQATPHLFAVTVNTAATTL